MDDRRRRVTWWVAFLLLGPWATASADPDLDRAIRTAASHYRDYGRVDEHPNVAPILCDAPRRADQYGVASHVRATTAHGGNKLYYLWSTDRVAYTRPKTEIPVGFTIVKESFAAVPATRANVERTGEAGKAPPPIATITDHGELLTTGERKDLFVMIKVGAVAGSDAGWIYGTVAPSGEVTSSGRVATCMHCHDSEATHDRLFGLRR
jgi:hypothetical protein